MCCSATDARHAVARLAQCKYRMASHVPACLHAARKHRIASLNNLETGLSQNDIPTAAKLRPEYPEMQKMDIKGRADIAEYTNQIIDGCRNKFITPSFNHLIGWFILEACSGSHFVKRPFPCAPVGLVHAASFGHALLHIVTDRRILNVRHGYLIHFIKSPFFGYDLYQLYLRWNNGNFYTSHIPMIKYLIVF